MCVFLLLTLSETLFGGCVDYYSSKPFFLCQYKKLPYIVSYFLLAQYMVVMLCNLEKRENRLSIGLFPLLSSFLRSDCKSPSAHMPSEKFLPPEILPVPPVRVCGSGQ